MTTASLPSGDVFSDEDVARCYRFRPPYSVELFDYLLQNTPHRARALDLGCGPGKIANVLALYFAHVHAVDPSTAMMHEARMHSVATNVQWICAKAEHAPFAGSLDLVTAGASIHWMDPSRVFPKLASCISPEGHVALIDGDGAHEPPWERAWQSFLHRWLNRVGQEPDSPGFVTRGRAHEPWIDVEAERRFSAPLVQPVREFVECQHSRATWARAAMGRAAAEEFDDELEQLLAPHTRDGKLSYVVETRLLWGRPRGTVREP